jgi:ABC-type phosphate transport system substrate-binding protein
MSEDSMKLDRRAALGLIGSGAAFAQMLVKVEGSSTVYPITEGVAEEFQKSKKGAMKVTVGISGTGGGFKRNRSCGHLSCELDRHHAIRPHLDRRRAGFNGY